MKSKGFTIVELLATILILGLITTMVVPVVKNSIDKGKEKSYKEQVTRIEKLAKQYALEKTEIIDNEGGIIYIEDLIKVGYLENKDVINPKTKEKMTGCVIVTYENDKFKYNYKEECID